LPNAKIATTAASTPTHHHVAAVDHRRVPESIAMRKKVASDSGTTRPIANFCRIARNFRGTFASFFGRLPFPPDPERNTTCPSESAKEAVAAPTEPAPWANCVVFPTRPNRLVLAHQIN
jgi:hypothetical protein